MQQPTQKLQRLATKQMNKLQGVRPKSLFKAIHKTQTDIENARTSEMFKVVLAIFKVQNQKQFFSPVGEKRSLTTNYLQFYLTITY